MSIAIKSTLKKSIFVVKFKKEQDDKGLKLPCHGSLVVSMDIQYLDTLS